LLLKYLGDLFMKKPIMIGIVIVCLALAVMITMKRRSEKNKYDPHNMEYGQIWVKCNDTKCNAAYEMDKNDYLIFLRENYVAPMTSKPAMVCNECGKKTVYEALKCEKCDTVFYPNEAKEGRRDTCPKCGYSKIEEIIKSELDAATK